MTTSQNETVVSLNPLQPNFNPYYVDHVTTSCGNSPALPSAVSLGDDDSDGDFDFRQACDDEDLTIPPHANEADVDTLVAHVVEQLRGNIQVSSVSASTIRFAVSSDPSAAALKKECVANLRRSALGVQHNTTPVIFGLNDGFVDGKDTHWGYVIVHVRTRRFVVVNTLQTSDKLTKRLKSAARLVRAMLMKDVLHGVVGHMDALNSIVMANTCFQPGGSECAYQAVAPLTLLLSDAKLFMNVCSNTFATCTQLGDQVNDLLCGVRLYTELSRANAAVEEAKDDAKAHGRAPVVGAVYAIARPEDGWGDFKTITRKQLLAACKERGIKGM